MKRKYTVWNSPVRKVPELEQLDTSAPPVEFTQEQWDQIHRDIEEHRQWIKDEPRRRAFNAWLARWCTAWSEIGWHASVDIRLNNLAHALHWSDR